MISKLKEYVVTHKHILFLLYIPIYFTWFTALEAWNDRDFNILHCSLDDVTPLIDWFIIPYYLWFPFVALFCVYFFVKTPAKEAIKLYSALMTGMTITLIIYTVWPNAVSLRPANVEPNGIFSVLLTKLYTMDTVTNVCPSLHVLNTLVIDVAFFKSDNFKGKTVARILMVIMSALICASTVFLKQHSYIDVVCAFAMCAFLYWLVYVIDWSKVFSKKQATATNA